METHSVPPLHASPNCGEIEHRSEEEKSFQNVVAKSHAKQKRIPLGVYG